MKNYLYLFIVLSAFALAIAVSNGKLGGKSDAEIMRQTLSPQP
jgi:hypothetical protein